MHFQNVDDVTQAFTMMREIEKNDSSNIIVLVFQQYLDADPNQFITEVKKQFNNIKFILISDLELSDERKAEILSSGYASILSNKPERIIFFRALHALSIENNNRELKSNVTQKLAENKPQSRLNILVSEDNETNQKVIKNILEYGEHTVTIANNGEIALDLLEQKQFDLIILDMQMPVMGGIEAAKIFRFMYPDKKDIPIIILTANATKEAKAACKEAKIDAYLTKPIEPSKLLGKIIELTDTNNIISNKKKQKSTTNVIDINDPENLPIIDTDTITTLNKMSNDENFLSKLISGYIHDAVISIEHMSTAIDNSEFKKVADLAHALDGSSLSIGAKRLAKIANKISNKCSHNNTSEIDLLFNELKCIFDETEQTLDSLEKEQKSVML